MEPIERLRLSNTNRPVDVIRHWRNEGMLLLNPPYQRGEVWGVKRKANLVRSMLLGVPIPSIVVNDRMNADWNEDQWQYAVIDGKQRCTAILQFLDSELFVPGEWFGLCGPVLYSDLPIVCQRRFKQQTIGFCEGSLKNIDQEKEVFELVNFGGVPQGETD